MPFQKLLKPPEQPRPLPPRDYSKKPETPPTMFEQLLPCKWRDVHIPISRIRVGIEQTLARHGYVGVDAESIEGTGRASMAIEALIPFYNGIVPGKAEKWMHGQLYPFGFRAFLAAFLDRRDGQFQHPELGIINCKPHTLEFVLDPMRRDGVEVVATWLETLDDENAAGFSAEVSPVQHDPSPAFNLDTRPRDIRGLASEYQPPAFTETFESALNKLSGFFDRGTTAATLLAGKKRQILFRIERVEDSVKRAKTPILWPVQDSIDKVRDTLLSLAPGGSSRRKVSRFKTSGPTDLSSLAIRLAQKVDDLIALNPNLLSQPEIGSGVFVRYYG